MNKEAPEYERVKRLIAERFKLARQEGAIRKWADGLDDADEILSIIKGIAILADEQSSPDVKDSGSALLTPAEHANEHYWRVQGQDDMLKANFKRVI